MNTLDVVLCLSALNCIFGAVGCLQRWQTLRYHKQSEKGDFDVHAHSEATHNGRESEGGIGAYGGPTRGAPE